MQHSSARTNLPGGCKQQLFLFVFIFWFSSDKLHGGLDRLGDSILMAWWRMNELMDAAISGDHIHPMIFVLPNSDAKLDGCFIPIQH